jgi:hypothetical protein
MKDVGDMEGLRRILIKAQVPRAQIVFYTHDREEDEIILASPPIEYAVISDVAELAPANLRWLKTIRPWDEHAPTCEAA